MFVLSVRFRVSSFVVSVFECPLGFHDKARVSTTRPVFVRLIGLIVHACGSVRVNLKSPHVHLESGKQNAQTANLQMLTRTNNANGNAAPRCSNNAQWKTRQVSAQATCATMRQLMRAAVPTCAIRHQLPQTPNTLSASQIED